ncbi:Ivy family c-type lysozyme inhibitor [Hydromonas duriensis]|uniref:Inhibitor of lysozyme (Ivy) n=1 Tax=Hydromonas duriensis TaxID=1527608 RepID=A0A4R6Y8P1_9BURK|nr:Ivy family c-type lysozyme inhibitor [Hydromonas duriensis]TDR31794.1 inhibitor of lysozyme (Ivy) [Hydromonas duriensis]
MKRAHTIIATAISISALLAAPMAHALQITNFDKLTRKQIEQSYYFDWNRNSTFRASIIKAFSASGISIPTWLHRGGGPSAPSQVIDSGSTHFVLLNTCKQHECSENNVYVLFDPATKATALAGKLDDKPVWIGVKNPTVKQILSNASGLR